MKVFTYHDFAVTNIFISPPLVGAEQMVASFKMSRHVRENGTSKGWFGTLAMVVDDGG